VSAPAPAGLISVQPAFLRRVFMLYALLAVTALAIPALLAQPRDRSAHPTEQEARRPTATSAAADAPGRQR